MTFFDNRSEAMEKCSLTPEQLVIPARDNCPRLEALSQGNSALRNGALGLFFILFLAYCCRIPDFVVFPEIREKNGIKSII